MSMAKDIVEGFSYGLMVESMMESGLMPCKIAQPHISMLKTKLQKGFIME